MPHSLSEAHITYPTAWIMSFSASQLVSQQWAPWEAADAVQVLKPHAMKAD